MSRAAWIAEIGLLEPRHVDAFHIEQLGKEANRLEEVQAGLAHQADEVYTLYQDARQTLLDAEAVLDECLRLQRHLTAQDKAIVACCAYIKENAPKDHPVREALPTTTAL